MKHFASFLALSLVASSSWAEIVNHSPSANQIHSNAQPITSDNNNNQFMDRQATFDSYGAPQAPIQSSPSHASTTSYETYDQSYALPVQAYPSSGQGQFYQPAAAYGSTAVSGFGANFLQTAIQVVLGLFAFSLLISLITKFAGASIFADLFGDDARHFNPDAVSLYTEMALNGIEKMKQIYEKTN